MQSQLFGYLSLNSNLLTAATFKQVFTYLYKEALGMVTTDELLMTKHAQDEALDDGLSRVEISTILLIGANLQTELSY